MYKYSDIQSRYKEKLVTADEAAALVQDGDRIYFGAGYGTVRSLDEALARRINDLHGLEIISLVNYRVDPFSTYLASNSNENVRFASTHMTAMDRKMQADGRCWYVPMQFRELGYYWYIKENKFDIVMLQVCPMDEWGNFNLGPQATDLVAAARNAKLVILEVNSNMPHAHGFSNTLNLADIDYVVESDNPKLQPIPSKPATEVDKMIAAQVISRISNGSTLQLGIGGLPNCLGKLLCESDIRNLGGHTEMLTDAYYDLFEAGKLSNRKKILDGKLAYSFAGGSQRLIDFIDNNPMLCCCPASYVNNVDIVAEIENFVSINSCMQVDLYGQIAAECIGFRQFSGTGGQLDFVMGAFKSLGGKSFICVPSTRTLKDGTLVTNISATLPEGSVVTTPRMITNYVVTEYGAVNLKGKSTWQRAEALISIAHPQFRDELIKQAEKMGVWKNSSKIDW